jgi:hypothetical protein
MKMFMSTMKENIGTILRKDLESTNGPQAIYTRDTI